MHRLTHRQRELVALRCGDRELTIDEAARAMGITRSTVKCLGSVVIRQLRVRTFNGVCRDYGDERARTTMFDGIRPELV